MIIAFTGKLGSGKDTAGERMVNMVDLPGRRVSFAAPLKESAAALLDIPTEAWEDYKNDPEVKILLTSGYSETPMMVVDASGGGPYILDEPNVIREFTAREFLQRYGTESHRNVFGDNFWVDQAAKKFDGHWDEFVYITDARFPNEADAIRRAGGIIVRVIGADEETGTHVSEAGLSDEYINFVLDNSVRDDGFYNLDRQLASVANALGLPLNVQFVEALTTFEAVTT